MLEWLVFVELVVLGWVVRMWDKEWGDVVLEKGWGGENVVLWVKGFLVLERGTPRGVRGATPANSCRGNMLCRA